MSREARITARADRKRQRQEGRTARVTARQETTRVMAEQGMRRGQGVVDLVSKGLDIAGERFSGGSQNREKSMGGDMAAGGAGALGMLLPLAVVGYVLMSKKKR